MFQLTEEGLKKVQTELSRYESRQSAIIPALYIAQSENNGFITDEIIEYLSKVMDLPASRINEVFKFYTMFNQQPVGRYHVQICNNISCVLNGSRELTDHVLESLGCKINDISLDGKFCVSSVECLGACGMAPMMQVNDDYHENLTPDKAVAILKGMK